MSDLTTKDLAWFRLANSNPHRDFYPFKDRFLRRFGTPDGWDKQEIERVCYSCYGSGEYLVGVDCNRCGGSGIYDTREHWLRRFYLGGQIYHKPEDNATVWHENDYRYPEFKNLIEGRVQHAPVDSKVARRAFFRLLIRHEPCVFYNLVCNDLKAGFSAMRAKLVWRLVRLRNKMDLFPAVNDPNSDVPF